MKTLCRKRVDLAFADPPFNIGYKYDTYDDDKPAQDYLAWTEEWIAGVKPLLTPTASVYVAIGIKYQAELKPLLDKSGLHWRDTICWHYTFGPHQTGKWTPSWVAIHSYVVDPTRFTWNLDAVKVPSARQLKYKDKRAKAGGRGPNNVWILLPDEEEKCFQGHHNAMLESRVCGTFKEWTGHPCQMPEAVLERIIKVSSNPGDLVFDPFAGSGATLATALKLGRRCLGIELSPEYAEGIRRRLEQIIGTPMS
jgi:site-specific DNA-methyltransferase (adenine-specific)